MKFVVAVVMLICAVAGVQSSLLAAVAPGVSYVNSVAHPAGLWGGSPWGAGAWGAGHWGAGPWGAGHWGAPAAVAVHAAPWGLTGPAHGGIPGISLAQGPGHAAAIAAPLAGHSGVYVAKTRGAVHTAPLAGHINSATSLNLAPAPGTL